VVRATVLILAEEYARLKRRDRRVVLAANSRKSRWMVWPADTRNDKPTAGLPCIAVLQHGGSSSRRYTNVVHRARWTIGCSSWIGRVMTDRVATYMATAVDQIAMTLTIPFSA
jgi:hypothetical protein